MGHVLAVLICIISFFLLVLTVFGIKGKIRLSLPVILVFSFILRLVLIVLYVNLTHYDVFSYKIIGDATLLGNNIYPEQALQYHPYLPFLLYIEALAVFFSSTGLPYMLFMKLFFSFFDFLNIILMYLVSNKNTKMAFLYAVHPAFLYLAAVHGQIDQIPIFFILLAVYVLQKKKEVLSSLFLGMGIMVKTWPIILFLLFLKYSKKRLLYLILTPVVPLCSIFIYAFVYKANVTDIIYSVLSYKGFAVWGLGMIAGQFTTQVPEKIFLLVTDIVATDTIVFLTLVFLTFSIKNITKEIFLFLLVFLTFSLRGANPLWLLPFAILLAPKFSSYWILVCGFYSAMTSLGEVGDTYKIYIPFLNEIWKFNVITLWILQLAMLFSYGPQIVGLIRHKAQMVGYYFRK